MKFKHILTLLFIVTTLQCTVLDTKPVIQALQQLSALEAEKKATFEGFWKGGVKGDPEQCPDSLFSEILAQYPNKYPWESHHITTEDGYILRAFRIQAKNTQMTHGKPVVFLQHGTLDSADDWVINEEENSIGIRLANEGYDVWLGNSRGNKYSLQSVKKMAKKDFWNFSFQEMAQYDVPANIKYVLAQTGMNDLIYIGHSQGTTAMFASLSDEKSRDYVNAKVSKYIALAPVTYLANCKSAFYNMMAWEAPQIQLMSKTWGIYDMSPGTCSETSKDAEFRAALCVIAKPFCLAGLEITDANPKYDNIKRLPYFQKHTPSGSSLKQFYHYAQWIKQFGALPKFQKYDYGYYQNRIHYGTEIAPEWDMSHIRTKVRAWAGLNDALADLKDTKRLESKLKELGVDAKMNYLDNCGHMTFMWGKNSGTHFIDAIIKELKMN